MARREAEGQIKALPNKMTDSTCWETGFMGIWEHENNLGNTESIVQAGQGPRRDGGAEAQGCGCFRLERLLDPAAATVEEGGQALPFSAGPRQSRSAHEANEQRNHRAIAGKGRS